MRFLRKDIYLIEIAKENPNDYFIEQLHGAGKIYSLICKQIQKSPVEWYDIVSRQTRTKSIIGQCFYWKGLLKSVNSICSKCHEYQFLKITTQVSRNLTMGYHVLRCDWY